MRPRFIYTGIRVKDLNRSIEFYTELMGMRVTGRDKIASTKGEVVCLKSEDCGFALELNYYEDGSPYNKKYTVGEGLDHLAFSTGDLDGFLAKAERMGHPMVAEIKTKRSRWAYISDPNGIWIELVK